MCKHVVFESLEWPRSLKKLFMNKLSCSLNRLVRALVSDLQERRWWNYSSDCDRVSHGPCSHQLMAPSETGSDGFFNTDLYGTATTSFLIWTVASGGWMAMTFCPLAKVNSWLIFSTTLSWGSSDFSTLLSWGLLNSGTLSPFSSK